MNKGYTRVLILSFVVFSACAASSFGKTSSTSTMPGEWHWKRISGPFFAPSAEVGSAQFEYFGSAQSVSAVRFRERRFHMEIVNDPADLSDSTSALAKRHDAVAAVNGSYFNMRELTPVTYVLEDNVVEGNTSSDELFRVDGMLAARGHRVDIFPCDPESYAEVTTTYADALASGPVLLAGGKVCHEQWPDGSFYSARHPRTIVGKTDDGWVYMIVIDGRSKGNAAGASLDECTQICRMFGLVDAINLDGGGSSALWTAADGVVSHPSDNGRFDHYGQRVVPNVVILRK